MEAAIGPPVAARFGRSVLELGGNSAAVVTPSVDLDLAVRGIVFAAAGTAGQRCTSIRRLIVHESVADELVDRVAGVYRQLAVATPSRESTLVGPLIDEQAFDAMQRALKQAVAEGGTVAVAPVLRPAVRVGGTSTAATPSGASAWASRCPLAA